MGVSCSCSSFQRKGSKKKSSSGIKLQSTKVGNEAEARKYLRGIELKFQETLDVLPAEKWIMSAGDNTDYSISKNSGRIDRFISHCWARDPEDDFIDNDEAYADIKTDELNSALVALYVRNDWDKKSRKVFVWIDKFCVPQDDNELKMYIISNHLENFIKLSDGLLVLCSTSYFTRLWCVYEWACFLSHKPFEKVEVCCQWLVADDEVQLPILLNSIADLTVQGARCFVEEDRNILREKIAQYYMSEDDFVFFVKVTSFSLVLKNFLANKAHEIGLCTGETEAEVKAAFPNVVTRGIFDPYCKQIIDKAGAVVGDAGFVTAMKELWKQWLKSFLEHGGEIKPSEGVGGRFSYSVDYNVSRKCAHAKFVEVMVPVLMAFKARAVKHREDCI